MIVFFFFKQETAYEMRISDWSSDVCSSDLPDASYSARMTMAVEIGRTKFPDRNNGNSSVVYWDPSTAISGHAILVGSSGVGKTHRLRYLIRSLITNTRHINIHILDVHGDIEAAPSNHDVYSEITEYGFNTSEIQ